MTGKQMNNVQGYDGFPSANPIPFRHVMATLSEGVAVLHAGRVIYANAALCEMSGKNRGEIIGCHFLSLAVDADRDLVEDCLKLSKTSAGCIDCRLQRATSATRQGHHAGATAHVADARGDDLAHLHVPLHHHAVYGGGNAGILQALPGVLEFDLVALGLCFGDFHVVSAGLDAHQLRVQVANTRFCDLQALFGLVAVRFGRVKLLGDSHFPGFKLQGPFELGFGFGEFGLRRFQRGLGPDALRLQVALGDSKTQPGLLQLGLGHAQGILGHSHRPLFVHGVQLDQQVAFFHRVADIHRQLNHLPARLAFNFHLPFGHHSAGGLHQHTKVPGLCLYRERRRSSLAFLLQRRRFRPLHPQQRAQAGRQDDDRREDDSFHEFSPAPSIFQKWFPFSWRQKKRATNAGRFSAGLRGPVQKERSFELRRLRGVDFGPLIISFICSCQYKSIPILEDEAEHRISVGVRYELTEKSALMLDYYYQSAEELEVSDLIDDSDPENTIYDWRQVENPSYNLFHLTFEQKFFDEMWYFRNARLQLYIKNLFDEEYYDARGYQATDRIYGAAFSFNMQGNRDRAVSKPPDLRLRRRKEE